MATTHTPTFQGFSPELLKFLDQLGRNNNREWFQKNRETYDAEFMAPAKAFVEALGAKLPSISPDIRAEPRVNGSIRRIHRDTRFSKDKTPYKTHLEFHFLQGEGKYRPGYYLAIKANSLGIGAGMYCMRRVLDKYRDAVAGSEGNILAAAIRKAEKANYQTGGEQLKRVPRGYDPDHQRADLLRHTGLFVAKDISIPKEFHSRSLVQLCIREFKKLSLVVDWQTMLVQ